MQRWGVTTISIHHEVFAPLVGLLSSNFAGSLGVHDSRLKGIRYLCSISLLLSDANALSAVNKKQ